MLFSLFSFVLRSLAILLASMVIDIVEGQKRWGAQKWSKCRPSNIARLEMRSMPRDPTLSNPEERGPRIRNLPSSSLRIGVGWLHVQRREPTAGIRATSLRTTSPATMPLTPPSSFECCESPRGRGSQWREALLSLVPTAPPENKRRKCSMVIPDAPAAAPVLHDRRFRLKMCRLKWSDGHVVHKVWGQSITWQWGSPLFVL